MTKPVDGHQIVTVLHENTFDHFILCDDINQGKNCEHSFVSGEDIGWDEDNRPGKCSFQDLIFGMSDFAPYRDNGEPYVLFSTPVSYVGDSNVSIREDPNGEAVFELLTENEYIALYLDGVQHTSLDFPISVMSVTPIVWTEDLDEADTPLWAFKGETVHYRPADPEWKQILKRRWTA